MAEDNPDRKQIEATVLLISDEIQKRFFEVLNDPASQWAKVPRPVAHGIAEVFVKVLTALALTDPNDLGFGLRLIDEVRRQLIARAGPPPAAEQLH